MIASPLILPRNTLIHELHPTQNPNVKKESCLSRIYRNHSDLISSIGNDILNTIILVSRVVKQIPHAVNRSAYFAYNLTGMFWINVQIQDLQKKAKDTQVNFSAYDFEGVITSAAKTAVAALNILLSASLLTAALISLAGMPQIALTIYSAMLPFSLFSFFTNIGCELYDYIKNKMLAKKFRNIKFAKEFTANSEKAKKVAEFFVRRLYNLQQTKCGFSEKKLARHTFKQLSYFQISAMLQKFQNKYRADSAQTLLTVLRRDQSKIGKLLQDLKKGLEDKNTYTKNNLGLITLGYVCMGICKAYPDTLIQSFVTWGISLLYTLKMIYEKTLNNQWADSLA